MALFRGISVQVFLYLCLCWTVVSGDLFTLGAGLASLASVAYEKVFCSRSECCTDRWISTDYEDLKRALDAKLYGQHLAINSVINHLKGQGIGQPRKAVAFSFHGGTGTGKTYTSKIIAETLYKQGLQSKYVHLVSATRDFNHDSKVEFYKDKLKDFIEARVKECPRSLFIIEEVDKMPHGILDSLQPYLDFYENVGGLDYRKATFIFVSNTAAGDIVNKALQLWRTRAASPRESITLKEMEDTIRLPAYNENSGLWHSDLIKQDLITAYVPFLPLERKHVRQCIKDSLVQKGYFKSRHDVKNEIVEQIANELTYIPEDLLLFAVNGCKRVDQKVDLIMFDK